MLGSCQSIWVNFDGGYMRYLSLVCLLLFIGCGSSESDQPENMMNDDGQGGAAGTELWVGRPPTKIWAVRLETQ